jgi:hypothetical protein
MPRVIGERTVPKIAVTQGPTTALPCRLPARYSEMLQKQRQRVAFLQGLAREQTQPQQEQLQAVCVPRRSACTCPGVKLWLSDAGGAEPIQRVAGALRQSGGLVSRSLCHGRDSSPERAGAIVQHQIVALLQEEVAIVEVNGVGE